MMFGGMFFFWLFGLLFMGLLIWGIWRLFSGVVSSAPPRPRQDEALQRLRRRLAEGEIDEAEYRRLKQLLTDEEAPS